MTQVDIILEMDTNGFDSLNGSPDVENDIRNNWQFYLDTYQPGRYRVLGAPEFQFTTNKVVYSVDDTLARANQISDDLEESSLFLTSMYRVALGKTKEETVGANEVLTVIGWVIIGIIAISVATVAFTQIWTRYQTETIITDKLCPTISTSECAELLRLHNEGNRSTTQDIKDIVIAVAIGAGVLASLIVLNNYLQTLPQRKPKEGVTKNGRKK